MEEELKLFVYGIFLGKNWRRIYGMTNPQYATVRDYATFGDYIVSARHMPGKDFSLTGLTVDLPEDYDWGGLDRLEGAYDRKVVKTTDGEEAFMYVGREKK